MPVTELSHWPDVTHWTVIALNMFQGPLMLTDKAISIGLPGMRAYDLTVACMVNGPFMGWAALTIGLVITTQPMDVRKTVTNPGPAVVLGAIFENAEFGDKGIHFRLAVGGLVIA